MGYSWEDFKDDMITFYAALKAVLTSPYVWLGIAANFIWMFVLVMIWLAWTLGINPWFTIIPSIISIILILTWFFRRKKGVK